MMKKFYAFLDNRIFPFVVKFFANPIVITITLLLLIPMIGFQKDVILILLLNSYMNVGSFGTSQITLRQVILTSDAQEQRAQETHDTVMEALKEIKEIVGDEDKENTELNEIKNLIQNGGMTNAK